MVKVNIGKKEVLIFTFIASIFVVSFAFAAWSNPPVSHDSESVKVKISGIAYSLQEAIDEGLIGGGENVLNSILESQAIVKRCGGFIGINDSRELDQKPALRLKSAYFFGEYYSKQKTFMVCKYEGKNYSCDINRGTYTMFDSSKNWDIRCNGWVNCYVRNHPSGSWHNGDIIEYAYYCE